MRRVTSNRRSLETDTGEWSLRLRRQTVLQSVIKTFTESEKGSKLDTLPEEKSHHSPSQVQAPTAIPTIQTTATEPYRRVYPEWKPSTTLDKTDVVGTIETLAGMTCKSSACGARNMQITSQLQLNSRFRCANSCSR